MLRLVPLLIGLLLSGAAAGQGYSTPARGTDLRADILDAVRPLAVWSLGAPVEFVVLDMRQAGDIAFLNLAAQRPGGTAIDLSQTPVVLRDDRPLDLVDGPIVQALLQRSGRMWVPVHHAVGPTDVWFADPRFCGIWASVLPEVCG